VCKDGESVSLCVSKAPIKRLAASAMCLSAAPNCDMTVCVLPGTELAFAGDVACLPAGLLGWKTKTINHQTAIFNKDKLAAQLAAVGELVGITDGRQAETVPVSAVTGEQIDVLIDVLAAALPAGPAYYPDGELTDEPEEVLMAEFIREAALEGVREELPHSLAVVIDEVNPREGRDDLIDVHAVLYVERDSQKGIVIGKGGARLREVGTAARGQIEKLLGTKVYLDLRVKVAKNWQRDPKQLGRLGF